MTKIKKPSELSIRKATQAWCTKKTSNKIMDEELAFAFAEILDEIWSKPWLGNATTSEILDELDARNINAKKHTAKLRKVMDLSYKTVREH
jgi:hypothetical protein